MERTLLERYQRGQHGLRHQDGVTFLFSLRNTSIPPPGYPIFPALLHLFPSESSSSLHRLETAISLCSECEHKASSPSHIAPFTPSEPTGHESKPKRDQAQAGLLLLNRAWILSVWTKWKLAFSHIVSLRRLKVFWKAAW